MPLNSSPTQIIAGRYQLVAPLGAGGMGSVYKAYDRLNQEMVALKKVAISNGKSGLDLRLILAQEFRVLASLRHPHIISVLDYGFDDKKQPYFTMNLVEDGQTILDAGHAQPLPKKISLLGQVLQALVYLHRRSILHRDIKPGNILVTEEQIRVLDFGLAIAKADIDLANGDTIVGTPGYIAPEILTGDAITEASDLYAVGVLAYELITGHHPFNVDDFMKRLYAPLTVTPDFEALDRGPDSPPTTSPLSTTIALSDEELRKNEVGQPSLPETRVFSKEDLNDEQNGEPPAIPVTNVFPPTQAILAADQPLLPELPPLPEFPLPVKISQVVRKLMARRLSERYQNASHVIEDLQIILGNSFVIENPSTRDSLLQAARFIGRETELAQLERAVEDVLQHIGQVWYITGESGVGKSRLFDELRIRALVHGALVLRGQSSPHSGPYHIWREPLRRLVLCQEIKEPDASLLKTVISDLDILLDRPITPLPAMDAEDLQKRLLATLHSLLQSQRQPIVLLLEDLHWAGEESLAVIQYLQQNIINLPLLIVGSYRDDEQFSLPDQGRTLQLRRFNEQEIADLSVAMLGETAQKKDIRNLLHEQTEGNPFFLVEVIRALADEAGHLSKIGSTRLPKSVFTRGVYEVVQRRLARVASEDLPLLQVAAAMGRELDLSALRKLSSDVEAWLYRCAEGNILEVQEEHWRFSHDKLREGVLTQLGETEKQAVHRQAAEIIEGLYTNLPERAATLAYHWEKAKDPAKQLTYTVKAGEHANQTSDNTRALEYFQTALTLLEVLQPVDRVAQEARIYVLMSQAVSRLGHGDEALDYIQKSFDRAEDRALQADAFCFRGKIHSTQGAYPNAVADLTQALDLYRSLQDQKGIASALSALGRAYVHQGMAEEAEAALQESLTLSRELDDTYQVAFALSSLGVQAMSVGDLEGAAQHFKESHTLYQKLGDRNDMAGALLHLGWLAQMQSQLYAANAYSQESERHFRETGDLYGLAAALNNQGFIALVQDQPVEAIKHFVQSLKISRESHDQWGTANTLSNLAQAELSLKDYSRALIYLSEALQIAHTQQATPLVLEVLFGFARVWAETQRVKDAQGLMIVILQHEAIGPDIKEQAEALQQTLIDQTSDELTTPGLEVADFDKVVQDIIRQQNTGDASS